MISSLLVSCGDDKSSNPTDTTPPSAVTSLAAYPRTDSSITLIWTAPGDDGTTGAATEYDIRYSTETISEESWESASQSVGELEPMEAGRTEMFIVTGLLCTADYHFALKARDEVAAQWSAISNVPSETTSPCGMVFVPAGTFTMGSPDDEPRRAADEEQHTVTLTKPFYLMDHEVTQGEWTLVMGSNPSFFRGDDNRPVELVTWFDAINYCNTRSTQEQLTPVYVLGETTVTWNPNANGYRLPTEAEWEFACRAGTQTAIANGGIINIDCFPVDPSLNQIGWYCGNAGETTHPVKEKAPNSLGLYDMHGNVWEWCWDWYGAYEQPYIDPAGNSSGALRVIRGGSVENYAHDSRSANRSDNGPNDHIYVVGLRPARTAF